MRIKRKANKNQFATSIIEKCKMIKWNENSIQLDNEDKFENLQSDIEIDDNEMDHSNSY